MRKRVSEKIEGKLEIKNEIETKTQSIFIMAYKKNKWYTLLINDDF